MQQQYRTRYGLLNINQNSYLVMILATFSLNSVVKGYRVYEDEAVTGNYTYVYYKQQKLRNRKALRFCEFSINNENFPYECFESNGSTFNTDEAKTTKVSQHFQ